LPALHAGWTLSFELLFYVSLALALVTRPVVPLIGFVLALAAGQLGGGPLFDFVGNPMITEFLFGVVVARLPRDGRYAPLLLIVAAACLTVAPLSMFPAEVAISAKASVWRAVFWGIPAALVLYAGLSLERLFSHRTFNPLVRLGDASYSIYLAHPLVIVFAKLPWPLNFAAAVGFGLLVWRFIERPIQRAKPHMAGLLHQRHATTPA
jgi:exopolysaccharide production protein ExoZ